MGKGRMTGKAAFILAVLIVLAVLALPWIGLGMGRYINWVECKVEPHDVTMYWPQCGYRVDNR